MELKHQKDWAKVKPFVINMTKTSNRETLHLANNPKCYYSKGMYEYLDFDTFEEAEEFGLERKKFNVCRNCFPEYTNK